jgi:DNA-binding transcriptional MerR regulator
MAPTEAPRYSLTELAGLAGVTPRTIRYYLSQGLLASSGTSGPGAKYDDGHLGRLRLIRKLQREHLPLAEIRQRLTQLDDESVALLADAPDTTSAPDDSALDYIRRVLGPNPITLPKQPPTVWSTDPPPAPTVAPRAAALRARSPITLGVEPAPGRIFERSQWERIPLAPDVELHVRRPLSRPLAKQVDRLVSIALDLLEEDQS